MLACVESNSPSPSCDCLAHRFGNAADGPDRVRCYGSDLTEAEWQVIRPSLSVPAWLQGRGGRPEGYCHRVRWNLKVLPAYMSSLMCPALSVGSLPRV